MASCFFGEDQKLDFAFVPSEGQYVETKHEISPSGDKLLSFFLLVVSLPEMKYL